MAEITSEMHLKRAINLIEEAGKCDLEAMNDEQKAEFKVELEKIQFLLWQFGQKIEGRL